MNFYYYITQSSNWTENILLNILGGILTALVIYFIHALIKRYRLRPLKRILGKDSLDEGTFNIVYPQFELDPIIISQLNNSTNTANTANFGGYSGYSGYSGISNPGYSEVSGTAGTSGTGAPSYPLIFKHWSAKIKKTISISEAVSNCEVRAINYISSGIFSKLKCQSFIHSDKDMKNKNDFSMISVGGSVAEVFEDLLLFVEKHFELTQNSFNNKRKGNIYSIDDDFDYGLIVKTTPKNSDDRIWISCFGIGEWGTSGSAWFLSNKYKELYDIAYAWSCDICSYNDNKFIAVIKVPIGNDEKAELVDFYSSKISFKEKVLQLLKKI